MPIKLDIHDNSSQVYVKPKSKDQVPVKNNCDIDKARFESLIDVERAERKAADEELQRQIDEGLIKCIAIDEFIEHSSALEYSGTITNQTLLNSLRNSKINKITFGNKVYYFSVKVGNIKQYFSTTSVSTTFPNEPSFNEVELNTETGYFRIVDSTIDHHLKDNTIHITEAERRFWNQKVTAYTSDPTPDIRGDGVNSTLVLDKYNQVDENGNVIVQGE